MSDIIIEYDQILKAAKILSTRSGYEDVPEERIAKVLSSHAEELINEMFSNPEHFFKTDYRLWQKIDDEALKAESEDLELAA